MADVPPAPLLSVIIVAYKSREEISACLGSLPQQLSGGLIEVIVVDNSPGDGAGEIVQRDFPWVNYLVPGKNLGFGRANNLGYAAAEPSSKFVLFLNPDTICNERALEHCIRRLQNDPKIGLISPKLVLADASMDLACRRSIPTLWDGFCRASGLAAAFSKTALFSGYNLTHLPESGTYDVGAINGAFMMGRREVFAAVAMAPRPVAPVEDLKLKFKEAEGVTASRVENGKLTFADLAPSTSNLSLQLTHALNACVFDAAFFMYGDDLDLCIRVAKAGWRIVYDGSVSITHLKGLSVAKDLDSMREAIFDANRDVYLKHFNPDGSKLVEWKYRAMFGLWKRVARWRAALRGNRKVRPL